MQGLDTSRSWTVQPGPLPQLFRYLERIDAVRLPPCGLVSAAVQGSMVGAAQRNCKLIADTPAEGARLGKTEMMSVRRPPAADEACVRRHEPEVRSIAVATWFTKCEGAFVDMPRYRIVDPPRQSNVFR
jgi:hypothetical protein